MAVQLLGNFLNLSIKQINESEVYKIKNFDEIKNKLLLKESFIKKKGLKIKTDKNKILKLGEQSLFSSSPYESLEDSIFDNIIQKEENFELTKKNRKIHR